MKVSNFVKYGTREHTSISIFALVSFMLLLGCLMFVNSHEMIEIIHIYTSGGKYEAEIIDKKEKSLLYVRVKIESSFSENERIMVVKRSFFKQKHIGDKIAVRSSVKSDYAIPNVGDAVVVNTLPQHVIMGSAFAAALALLIIEIRKLRK